jgi:hypothetical protein
MRHSQPSPGRLQGRFFRLFTVEQRPLIADAGDQSDFPIPSRGEVLVQHPAKQVALRENEAYVSAGEVRSIS